MSTKMQETPTPTPPAPATAVSLPVPAPVPAQKMAPKPAPDGKNQKENLPKKPSSVSATSGLQLSDNAKKSDHNSLASIMSRSKPHSNSSASKKGVGKKKAIKPYEPIRLPKDILTIQAHTASTPVTELPYLLIAAHIGSLPSARQFYPTTSSSITPLTVFRDMFVMTMDVRGYKPSSVRMSTEGRLIIIECLQSEVPPVEFTQTGTVDANGQYVIDAAPNIQTMPVHTSFNYTQHRIKLPEEFSEEGLKVGMDDVTGHVIITGRLVHDQNAAFPEKWNKTVPKTPKGPIVNTSSSNLSKDEARKLAAWHAVQSQPQLGKHADEILNRSQTGAQNLIGYGRKQWLEAEGAKLRAIQHRALKDNIKRLNDIKKESADKKPMAPKGRPNNPETEAEVAVHSASATNTVHVAHANALGAVGHAFLETIRKLDSQGKEIDLKVGAATAAESRPRVSFQPGGTQQMKKKSSVSTLTDRGKASKKKSQKIIKQNSSHKQHPISAPSGAKKSNPESENTGGAALNDDAMELKENEGNVVLIAGESMDSTAVKELAGDNPGKSKMAGSVRSSNENETNNMEFKMAASVSSVSNIIGENNSGITDQDTALNIPILSTHVSNYQVATSSGKSKSNFSPFKESSPKRENSPSTSPLWFQTPIGNADKIIPPPPPPTRMALATPKPEVAEIISPISIVENQDTGNFSSNDTSGSKADGKLGSKTDSKSRFNNLEDVELEEFSYLMNPDVDVESLDELDDPVGKEDKSMWEKLLVHARAGADEIHEELPPTSDPSDRPC